MAIVHKQQNTPVIKNNHHQPKKVQKWQKKYKNKRMRAARSVAKKIVLSCGTLQRCLALASLVDRQ